MMKPISESRTRGCVRNGSLSGDYEALFMPNADAEYAQKASKKSTKSTRRIGLDFSTRDTVSEVMDEMSEPLRDIFHLKQLLTLHGVIEKSMGHYVRDSGRILDSTQVISHRFGHGLAFAAHLTAQIYQFECERSGKRLVRMKAGACDDCGYAEWCDLLPTDDLHPLYPRQHEMRSSVLMCHARPNEACCGDRMDWVRVGIGIDPGKCIPNTNHTVMLQCILQHGTIAFLEYEQRHVTMGI